MGNIASLWRYDAGAYFTLREPKRRRPVLRLNATMAETLGGFSGATVIEVRESHDGVSGANLS
jgi:hypothetical protein